MQRKPLLIVALAVLVAAQVIAQTEYRVWDGRGSDHDGQDGQGSLDLDTPGCPTTFGAPTCEQQTSWTLDKTTASGPFEDPLNQPFSFNVTVTEGASSTVLTGSGQIVITNSGELSAGLSSIVVLLEDHASGGGGDAPGPSGKNWQVLGAAIAVESALCEAAGVAKTCRGDILQTSGASLVLYDADSNDIIALSDVLPVPPSTCADPLIINFSYEFDIEGLGIEGPGDGVVPSDDDLRIDLIATFGGAGPRGNSEASCTVDANCNGLIDPDNTATPDVDESELDNIRSIQQRLRFQKLGRLTLATRFRITG